MSKFAIIGAGIGGLTLAIAMQRQGLDVVIYENAAEIKPLGAGLGLAANAIKAFMSIGISEDVLRVGLVINKLSIKDDGGRILYRTNMEKVGFKKDSVDQVAIHRADLHLILLKHLKVGTLQLNKGCIDFNQDKQGVTIKFNDNTTAYTDYLIACDGVHSVIRKKLIPNNQQRYAGYTCWRAVIDSLPLAFNPDEFTESWGKGKRFGMVPLPDHRLYWFACINAKQNDPIFKAFSIKDLLACFGNFHAPIPKILQCTSDDQLIWNDIVDLKPANQFVFNRIALLGDAAHATTPNLAQGACMAIEDAVILANLIKKSTSVAEAFSLYEQIRLQRTIRIVKNSWRLGKIAQWENPVGIGLRNTAMRITPASLVEKQMKFISDITFS